MTTKESRAMEIAGRHEMARKFIHEAVDAAEHSHESANTAADAHLREEAQALRRLVSLLLWDRAA